MRGGGEEMSAGKHAPFVLASRVTCAWCGEVGVLRDLLASDYFQTEPIAPVVGDCSICRACGLVNLFALLDLRRPSREELDDMEAREGRLRGAVAHLGSSTPTESINRAIQETRRTINAES